MSSWKFIFYHQPSPKNNEKSGEMAPLEVEKKIEENTKTEFVKNFQRTNILKPIWHYIVSPRVNLIYSYIYSMTRSWY